MQVLFLAILKMVHITNAPCFCMILGPDLIPTSDDMPKFVDIIIVNGACLAKTLIFYMIFCPEPRPT